MVWESEVLELKIKSLLAKWLFKLLNEEGVWQQLLHNKYLHSKTLSQVSAKPTDFAFWKGLMNVKDDFFNRGHFRVGNGKNTSFWEDTWLGDRPLSEEYPSLFNIVRRKNVTVEDALSSTPLNIGFRRALIGNKWNRWLHLVERLMTVQLSDQQDVFVWNLTSAGIFSVKSLCI